MTTSRTSSAWQIVMVREIMTKLRDKGFIVSTLFTVTLIVVALGASVWAGNGNEEYTVATSSSEAEQMVENMTASAESETEFSSKTFADEASAQNAVKDEEADAYLHQTDGNWTLTFNSSADRELSSAAEQTVATVVTAHNASELGVDLNSITEGSKLTIDTLSEEDNSFVALMIALGFAMIFTISTMVFGQLIAMSVNEEKQNRIVEIIATAIPINQLLAGKIIGNVLLAISQIALYAVIALVGLNITGTAGKFGWVLSSAGWFIAFYIVGFAAIATIWAAVGAMASRSEDIGNLSMPLMIVLMAAMYAGIYAKGAILTFVSFIPIASSIAMPIRLLTEDVAMWEPAIALLLCLIATWLLTQLGARIYTRTIMRGGTAVTWKQALSQKF